MARRYRVTGRVQGVGFRYFVVRQAAMVGVSGWVRNDPDGAVSALAAGEEDALARFRARLATGPPASRVDHVEESPAAPPAEAGFHVA
ncbi:MAG: acylphosphatase [Acidobacteria bacterium]|nr:acylphosphatase [Acidobacteriota bacterium]